MWRTWKTIKSLKSRYGLIKKRTSISQQLFKEKSWLITSIELNCFNGKFSCLTQKQNINWRWDNGTVHEICVSCWKD